MMNVMNARKSKLPSTVAGRKASLRKGMSGKMLAFLMALVLGIVALAFLWIFFSEAASAMVTGIDKIMMGLRCWFCQLLGPWKLLWGGMCTGCK